MPQFIKMYNKNYRILFKYLMFSNIISKSNYYYIFFDTTKLSTFLIFTKIITYKLNIKRTYKIAYYDAIILLNGWQPLYKIIIQCNI